MKTIASVFLLVSCLFLCILPHLGAMLQYEAVPTLAYSTYLGGARFDDGYDIALDGAGNLYVTGLTTSKNFPTYNAWQTSYRPHKCPSYAGEWCPDVFVAKFDRTGKRLIYSTYLGGNDWEAGNAIAVDRYGNAFVAGRTYSTDFPTVRALQSKKAWVYDAFVTKFNPSGSALDYSTYVGGRFFDQAQSIALGANGSAFITGSTASMDFPVCSS